jgi:predicted transglutaminase-like cysteine proteinase
MIRSLFITSFIVQLVVAKCSSISDESYITLFHTFGNKGLERVEFVTEEIKKIKKRSLYVYGKLTSVNRLLNKIQYKKDSLHWGIKYNATFLEFIASGAGDSLDFAFAKYVTLLELGLDPDKFHFFTTTTNIRGMSKLKYDTVNYYVLGYDVNDGKNIVILDCYNNKLTLAKSQDLYKYKKRDIPSYTCNTMKENMFCIVHSKIFNPLKMGEVSLYKAP